MKAVVLSLSVVGLGLITSPSLADVKPYFGYSGKYPGTVKYGGNDVEATLELVQFGSVIRGVINTKIKYRDRQDHEWEGTGLLVKGSVDESGKIHLRMTDHQCSGVADLCSNSRSLSAAEVVADVSPYQVGSDYVLYEVSFAPQDAAAMPVQSAHFKMESTIAAVPPDPNEPFYGVWDIEAYGLDNLVYALPGPLATSDFYNLTLFSIGQRDHINIFGALRGHWEPLNDVIGLQSSSYTNRAITLNCGGWKHDLSFTKGYVFGIVRYPSQTDSDPDFEAVTWGSTETGSQAVRRAVQ